MSHAVLKEKERTKYKVFPMRLHEETKKILVAKQKESGLSWNLYIYKLLKGNVIK